MGVSFKWDEKKNIENQRKHNVSFEDAQFAFADKKRIILCDAMHSKNEKRYFCIAKIKEGIVTVRFIYRNGVIRIFGAAFWRKGRRKYLKDTKGKI